VVIFGNGYDSVNGEAVLYILNVDGTLIRKIHTQATGCNGLSTPALVDINWDNRLDYVYAGDLNGNMWKFDLTDSNPDNWDVAYKYEPYT
jgi:type IV pilus assembly protein PilY1